MFNAASKVLSEHWDGSLPVDVKRIAASLGIEVRLSHTIQESGMIELDERGGRRVPVITYKASDAPVRQRFTIAHEIGHYALGHLQGQERCFRDPASNFSSGGNSPLERAANDFAAKLLMPEKVVKFAVYEKSMTNVENLSETFGVSQVAMKYRLANMGMV